MGMTQGAKVFGNLDVVDGRCELSHLREEIADVPRAKRVKDVMEARVRIASGVGTDEDHFVVATEIERTRHREVQLGWSTDLKLGALPALTIGRGEEARQVDISELIALCTERAVVVTDVDLAKLLCHRFALRYGGNEFAMVDNKNRLSWFHLSSVYRFGCVVIPLASWPSSNVREWFQQGVCELSYGFASGTPTNWTLPVGLPRIFVESESRADGYVYPWPASVVFVGVAQ